MQENAKLTPNFPWIHTRKISNFWDVFRSGKTDGERRIFQDLLFCKVIGKWGVSCRECFYGGQKTFQPRGFGMPHLKFFQEHCSLLIDQQRGQWWWHTLKNITRNAQMGLLSLEFVIFVSEIPVTSKWKSSSSNNNSTFSRLWLMLTILLWKMEKLDLTMFSGVFP